MNARLRAPETLPELGQSVSDFLESNHPSARELAESVVRPLQSLGEVCVIGGLVRDIAFYGLAERPVSDVDLVVAATPEQVRRVALSLGAKPNRFGGFGVTSRAFKADFWAMSTTWAIKGASVRVRTLEDLRDCTFFDWDGVVFSTTRRKVFALPRYLDRLKRRVLEINLETNPNPTGNLVRALRRLVMWDARAGQRLRSFIERNLPQHEWRHIQDLERQSFTIPYLGGFSSSGYFKTEVLYGKNFSGVGRDDRRQAAFLEVRQLRDQYRLQSIPDDLQVSIARPRRKRSREAGALGDLFESQDRSS